MKILSIDTTSPIINIVLIYDGKIYSLNSDVKLNEYESIISLIDLLLKKSKLDIKQIDYFGVCTGPGSFTGMRIGLSTIKALAYSLNKPVISYNSLDLAAWMFKDKFSGLLCIMQDAKRSNIYSAFFRSNKGLNRAAPYLLVDFPQLVKRIKKIKKPKQKLYFYGDIVSHYKEQISKYFPQSILLLAPGNISKSNAMISLSKANINNSRSPFKLLPFYMYPKDCQVRKPQK